MVSDRRKSYQVMMQTNKIPEQENFRVNRVRREGQILDPL